MQPTTIFFDLDDTLYPASTGLWPVIRNRIGKYMIERLNVSEAEMPSLRKRLFEEYGTTLRGLQHTFTVDVSDFLEYVHAVPLTDFLSPDPILQDVLERLPARKFIFTNADSLHAKRVMKILQIEKYFEGIIDVVSLEPYCKPMQPAFEIALRTSGETDPGNCVMLDDISRTTRAAHDFGFYSILFGTEQPTPDADAVLTDWSKLPELLNGRINAP